MTSNPGHKSLHLVTLLLILSSPLLANEVTGLSALGVEIKQDLPRGFNLEFVHDLRFINNPSALHKSISELELSFKVNKYLSLGTGYRYSIYPDKYSERGTVSGSLGLKTGPLAHKLRFKYQHDADSDDPAEEYVRSRYSMTHRRIYGVQPFVYGELYFGLDVDQLTRKRLSFGLERNMTENVSFMIYFLSQTEMNVDEPGTARILGARFGINLK
jgi:hypothetical protein